MLKVLAVAGLCLAASACTTTPGLAMKIEAPPAQARVLLGQFVGSVALVQGDPKNAAFHASDGLLTCDGQSNNGQFSTDIRKNRIAHTFEATCSNGITGRVIINITSAASFNGIGVGTLSDGSRVRVIVGDISGSLTW